MRRIPIKNVDRLFTELAEVESFHAYNVDIRHREIIITGEEVMSETGESEPGVDHVMSARLIRNLRLLVNRSDKPILIHLKTCGGDWNEGMAMYDAIIACPVWVTVLNYTHARSMSSLVMQAADRRVMMPHSEFMFHHGSYTAEGELVTVQSGMEHYKKSMQTMLDIYAEAMTATDTGYWGGSTDLDATGCAKKWLNRQMDAKNDVFLTAERTVYHGLADCIFNGDWDKLVKVA